MNLWINSRATHCTRTEIVHVYFWMLDDKKVSGEYRTESGAKWDKPEIIKKLNASKSL